MRLLGLFCGERRVDLIGRICDDGLAGPEDIIAIFSERYFFGCEADDPLATNSDGASYRVAVAIGYCSGCSTSNKVTSTPGITLGGGGASAA